MKKITLLGLVALIGLGACTAGSSSHRVSAPAPAVQKVVQTHPEVAIGRPVHSIVEGLPVPADWKLVHREHDGYNAGAWYAAPSGVTEVMVRSWYVRHVAPGRRRGRWTWCNGIPTHGTHMFWSWIEDHNDEHVLTIVVEGWGAHTTGVHLDRRDSGLCRQ